MSIALRIILLIGAVGMLWYVIKSIRKSRIQMKDAFVWIVIALLIAIFGMFPVIPMWIAGLVGIESAANMVFLIFIAILLLRIFTLSIRLSLLEDKCVTLTGEVAIRTKKENEDIQRKSINAETSE